MGAFASHPFEVPVLGPALEPQAPPEPFLSLAPVGLCTFDARGTLLQVNAAAAELFEGDPEELANRPFPSLVRGLDHARFWEHLNACGQSQSRRVVELQFQTLGGRRLAVELYTTARQDPATGRIVLLSAVLDRTERALLEERLQLLTGLGQCLDEGLDAEQSLRHATRFLVPRLAELCVVTQSDPQGRRCKVAHVRPALAEQLEAELSAGLPAELEAELATADGSARLFSPGAALGERLGLLQSSPSSAQLLAVPLSSRAGHRGWLLLASSGGARVYVERDVALARELAQRISQKLENVALYQQALRDVQLREDFLAVVSHDLVNATSGIRFSVQSLRDAGKRTPADRTPGARLEAAIERIDRSARWMQELIRKLLDIARLESGSFPLERAPTPMAELLELARGLTASAASVRELLPCFTSEPSLSADADPARLVQVLVNLLENAIKFTPPGRNIWVRAEAYGPWVRVSVCDEGPGIAAAELSHVFDRFWQSPTSRRGGVGLGLAIAKGIVEAHGGRLWVDSLPGQGSTFSFTVPRARSERSRGEPETDAGAFDPAAGGPVPEHSP